MPDHAAPMSEIRADIAHYQEVQAQFGDDDMSDAYNEAIGNVPNYHIREDGSVIRYGEGGKEEPVRILPEPEAVLAKVEEWNEVYRDMGREMRLKDLSEEAYEAEVGYGLLDVCGHDIVMIEAVFNSGANRGGWMLGDAVAFCRKKIEDTPVS